MKKCPYCAEEIQDEAVICRFCGLELVHQVTPVEEVAQKRATVLNEAIADYQSYGWVLLSNNNGIAQLKKPKSFSWGCFIIGLLLLLIVALIYLVYYAVQSEELLTLTTDEQANLVVSGKTILLPVELTPEQKAEAKIIEQKSTKRALISLGIFALVIILVLIVTSLNH